MQLSNKLANFAEKYYRVEKMRFPSKNQKDTIIYNSKVRIENIPVEAYNYVVNGKSAIEWIHGSLCRNHAQGKRHCQRPPRLGERK